MTDLKYEPIPASLNLDREDEPLKEGNIVYTKPETINTAQPLSDEELEKLSRDTYIKWNGQIECKDDLKHGSMNR